MSDASGGEAGERGEAGGNQPNGGQSGGANASQGQPQGAYQRGPGVGDIFSRPETVTEMKIGAALFGLVTLGLGVTGFGFSLMSGGAGGGFGGGMGMGMGMGGGLALIGALLFVPLIGLVVGLRQADVLDDQPPNLAYANAGVTTFVGTFVSFVISVVFLLLSGTPGIGQAIGQLIAPVIVAGIGGAIVAAGAVWVAWNVVPTRGTPTQQSADQQPR